MREPDRFIFLLLFTWFPPFPYFYSAKNTASLPQLCSRDSEKCLGPNFGIKLRPTPPPRAKREGEIKGTKLEPLATYSNLEYFLPELNFVSSEFLVLFLWVLLTL
jgi:hypothetical protein